MEVVRTDVAVHVRMINIDIKVNGETVHPLRRVGQLVRHRRTLLVAGAVLISVPVVATAAPIGVTNTFSAGEVISASEVNANFTDVVDGVNANDTAITDHESRVAALETTSAFASCEWVTAQVIDGVVANANCPAGKFAITGSCQRTVGTAAYIGGRQGNPLPSDGDPALTATQWSCAWAGNVTGTARGLCCN